MEIQLQVTKKGGLRMLHDDLVDLSAFGKVRVNRASNVEFNNRKGAWFVQSVATGVIMRDDFKSRAEALDWEKRWFSPSGDGWKELTGGR